MNEFKLEKLKSEEALISIIKQEKLLVPYSCYWSICPEEHGTKRIAYLGDRREISPYVVHRIENYAYIKTSTRLKDPISGGTKYEYQLNTLLDDGREVFSADEIGDDNLKKFFKKKKIKCNEPRVIILKDKEIKLMDEVVLFFNPLTNLELIVEDIDGYFSYYYEGEKMKGSNSNNGDTRTISELIINSDSFRMPYDLVLPNKKNPENVIPSTINSLRMAISKALVKKFELIGKNFLQINSTVLMKSLLDVYAPFVKDGHLIKFSKTKFIKK